MRGRHFFRAGLASLATVLAASAGLSALSEVALSTPSGADSPPYEAHPDPGTVGIPWTVNTWAHMGLPIAAEATTWPPVIGRTDYVRYAIPLQEDITSGKVVYTLTGPNGVTSGSYPICGATPSGSAAIPAFDPNVIAVPFFGAPLLPANAPCPITAGTYDTGLVPFTISDAVQPGTYELTTQMADQSGGVFLKTQLSMQLQDPPAVTSADATTFTPGVPSSFTVTTSGDPVPALQQSGALPGGVTFTDNGDGTATVAYDGTATTAGPYPITITASNGVSPDAMQNFTLTMVGTLYVAQSGSDPGNTCGSSATPCATISNAVSQAASGDTIDVAGTIDDHVTVPSGFGTLTITQWPGQAAAEVDGAATGTPFTINSGDTVTLDQLTVENGSIVAPGGGIVNGGTLTVTDSTISNNTASTYGGGIYNYGGITVTDSTISNNTAYFGGGIYNDGGTLTVTDSTISNNTAGGSGGGIVDHGGTANIGATIVAGNTGGNCGGAATSVGYNLTDDTSGTACGFTQSSDVVNANPDLGSLADNGGTTKTLLPSNNSPAVGKIPLGTTLNGVSVCPGLDQHGVARPQPAGGTACSIGAVEVAPAVPAITSAASTTFTSGTPGSFTVTATGNPIPSLTEAGGLPTGVTFTDNGDGTATFGYDGTSSTGAVSLMITASNGVMPDAIQNFGLIFRAAVPSVTSVRPASGPTGGANGRDHGVRPDRCDGGHLRRKAGAWVPRGERHQDHRQGPRRGQRQDRPGEGHHARWDLDGDPGRDLHLPPPGRVGTQHDLGTRSGRHHRGDHGVEPERADRRHVQRQGGQVHVCERQ